MVVKGSRKGVTIYQAKVTLMGVSPPVWRRFLVADEATLGILHHILQVVMGWDDYHVHLFKVGDAEFGAPGFMSRGMKNENGARLSKVVTGMGMKMYYLYDLGDRWLHEVVFEKSMPPEQGMNYPVCIEGKRACPPEDCGGPGGYEHFLEVIGNPEDPEHEEMLEWAGGEFDPEAFDMDEVNDVLSHLREYREMMKEEELPFRPDMIFL
jgi:hypothetical protein